MPRIAVLLEPLLTCSNPQSLAGIAGQLCGMLLREDGGQALGDMRIICGAPAAAQLAAGMPAARPYLIQPATDAQAAFVALAAGWSTRGQREWSAIQAGSAGHAHLYEAVLLSARNAYSFDVLAYWGMNETLRSVAARRGIPMLWAERGLRQPFAAHFSLDPHGVRPARSRGPDAAPDAGAGLPGVSLETGTGGLTAYEAALMLPTVEPEDLDALLRFTSGQRRVVLLAVPFTDDAGARTSGNGWFCRAVTDAVLEAQAGPGTVFVLRPYPAGDPLQDGRAVQDTPWKLLAGRSDVMVFDSTAEGAHLACMAIATEVVCINSTVGIEAALMGKLVRILGQPSLTPPNASVAGLHGPAPHIPDGVLRHLLTGRHIPEDRFWTLACWRQAAAGLPGIAAGTGERPVCLPTAELRVLGHTRISGGTLWVDGIGPLPLLAKPGDGSVDAVVLERDDAVVLAHDGPGGTLHVTGWGVDPGTGTILAGVLVTAGTESVWSSACVRRPDVALHGCDPVRLASGFDLRVPLSQLGAAGNGLVRVFGVTTAGHCVRLLPDWEFDPLAGGFVRVPVGTAAVPALA
ncbi:MAG: hypothetical protein ACRYHQ_03435 [Janthinobacterium lividum]